MDKSSSIHLPLPTEEEDEELTKWWNQLFERVAVQELLTLATAARGGHNCHFGHRTAGTYNAVLFIAFDDGVEWVAKIPKLVANTRSRMISEFAALKFISEDLTIPAPRVHAFAFDCNNVANTPYLLMDRVSGTPLYEALRKGLSSEGIHKMLRQLANIRKSLRQQPFEEIGSLTIVDFKNGTCGVDEQISIWNLFDSKRKYRCRSGPFETSLEYYANLLHSRWSNVQYHMPDPEEVNDHWQVQSYLGSVLASYVGEDTGEYFLAHTDLDAQNILVDDNGSIAVIDWEFASTLPLRAAEHYPKLLSNESNFVKYTSGIFTDPQTEFREWRRIYAEQFVGDDEMGSCLKNIDAIIAFENLLRDHNKGTMTSVVETFKFVDSESTFENIGLPFPWKTPKTKQLLAQLPEGPDLCSLPPDTAHPMGSQLFIPGRVVTAQSPNQTSHTSISASSPSKCATGPSLPFPAFEITSENPGGPPKKHRRHSPSHISSTLKICSCFPRFSNGGRGRKITGKKILREKVSMTLDFTIHGV